MRTNDSALKKFEIMRELSYVPADRLNEIDSFIKFILSQSKIRPGNGGAQEPETLAGIWEGKGFEKIDDLDKEIRDVRKDLGKQLLE